MDPFTEKKAKRAGIVTPLALLKDVADKLEKREIDRIIVIGLEPKGGEVFAGWSGGMNNFELRGALDAGKDEIIGMIEEED